MHDTEKLTLQRLGDRTNIAFPDYYAVDRPNRGNFGGGPGEERFVCDVQHLARYAGFGDRNPKITCQLNDGIARDARQD